jgi:Uma2 family endonuclease
MTQTKLRFASFEEYIAWSDDAENFLDYDCELIDGELVPLPTEAELNSSIANFILVMLVSIGAPLRLVHAGKCEVQVPVLQPKDAANRIPDLVVLRPDHLTLTQRRLTITLEMPPPVMVVEVVSPGKRNHDRDYSRKLAQYQAIGIEEYWIVDPVQQKITVFQLETGGYRRQGEFLGDRVVHCASFPALALTAEAILSAGS